MVAIDDRYRRNFIATADYRLWPGPTNRGMAAISLPTVAKRCIPAVGGQDARLQASSGPGRGAP
jgi:hypothetical protein